MHRSVKIGLVVGAAIGVLSVALGIPLRPPQDRTYDWLESNGLDPYLTPGIFLLVVSAVLAVQNYYTSRKGYAYCGPVQRVYKDQDPRPYRFWLWVQCALVALTLALAVVFITVLPRIEAR